MECVWLVVMVDRISSTNKSFSVEYIFRDGKYYRELKNEREKFCLCEEEAEGSRENEWQANEKSHVTIVLQQGVLNYVCCYVLFYMIIEVILLQEFSFALRKSECDILST